jgi:uncharacterized protein (TIGR02147 family)
MSIFEYKNYKKWVNFYISSMPKGGRGQYRKMSEHMRTSATIVTQVFKGERELTPEQALLLADYFALSKFESRYLVLIVNYARAGSLIYKERLHEEIIEMQERSKEIANRVKQDFKMTEEVKSIFYSNWYYLAIWSLTAINGFNDLNSICERLKINKRKAKDAIEFMIKNSIIIEDNKGRLTVGPSLLHLESSSSQIARHHQNWRLQAFRKYEELSENNLFYTAPVTLSEKDAQEMNKKILKFISESVSLIKDSPSEKLYAICLDWFEV